MPSRLRCHKGTLRHTTTLFLNPKKSYSAEARAAMSERSRRAILRRISQALFQSPTKNPAVAAKVRAALLLRHQQGKGTQPTQPDRDPLTGQWKPKAVGVEHGSPPSSSSTTQARPN
jgi:hypothetical protein